VRKLFFQISANPRNQGRYLLADNCWTQIAGRVITSPLITLRRNSCFIVHLLTVRLAQVTYTTLFLSILDLGQLAVNQIEAARLRQEAATARGRYEAWFGMGYAKCTYRCTYEKTRRYGRVWVVSGKLLRGKGFKW